MSQFTKQLKTTMSTTPQRFMCRYNPALQLCPYSVTRCYSADRWPASTCSRTLGTNTRTIKLCLHSRRRLAQVWTCLHCHQSMYTQNSCSALKPISVTSTPRSAPAQRFSATPVHCCTARPILGSFCSVFRSAHTIRLLYALARHQRKTGDLYYPPSLLWW